MELRKLNRIAAASAVFFAFVALGVRSNVNVLAKDDLAFDASELKDKKTYKNTTVSSNDGFSIYAKSSVVSTSTKTITYGDYSFNRGLVSNSTDGIKITANSDNIQFNVYYTVSTNNSFRKNNYSKGTLTIKDSSNEKTVTDESVSSFTTALTYSFTISSADDYVWLGSTSNNLVVLGISYSEVSTVRYAKAVDTSNAYSQSTFNKHLDANTLKGDFTNNKELCTDEELGYFFSPYNNGNIYKYNSDTKAEYADYILVEPSGAGIEFYNSSNNTSVSFEIEGNGYLGISAFGLLDLSTNQYVAPVSTSGLSRRLFQTTNQFYVANKTTVTYNLTAVGSYALVFPSMFLSTGGRVYSADVTMEYSASLNESFSVDNDGTVNFVGVINGLSKGCFNDVDSAYFDIDISNLCSFTSKIGNLYEKSSDYGLAYAENQFYCLGYISGLYSIGGGMLIGETVSVSLVLNLSNGSNIYVGICSGVIVNE